MLQEIIAKGKEDLEVTMDEFRPCLVKIKNRSGDDLGSAARKPATPRPNLSAVRPQAAIFQAPGGRMAGDALTVPTLI
uniref:Uncharacterized protein n=1 Tax=Aegilops tauschii subsp. strangulata TaxID=200361 RepID=A0A453DWD0_AEGTS